MSAFTVLTVHGRKRHEGHVDAAGVVTPTFGCDGCATLTAGRDERVTYAAETIAAARTDAM